MIARGAHGTHPCNPETLLAGSRNNELQLVAMRRTGPRRDAVVVTTAFHLDEAKEFVCD
jgi:hypothetical protein